MTNPLFEQYGQYGPKTPESSAHEAAEVIHIENGARLRQQRAERSLPGQVRTHQAEMAARPDSHLPTVESLKVSAIRGIDSFIGEMQNDALRASDMFANESSASGWNVEQEEFRDAA